MVSFDFDRETFFGAERTVTLHLPTIMPPDLTVMVAEPFYFAVITPFLLTLATDFFDVLKIALLIPKS